jgi:hypothetical protein
MSCSDEREEQQDLLKKIENRVNSNIACEVLRFPREPSVLFVERYEDLNLKCRLARSKAL